jgi:hypothetical protein
MVWSPARPMILGSLSRCRLLAWLVAFCLLTGCARSAWDGRTYANDNVRFQTGPVAPGWRSIEPGYALLAFQDAARDLVISVNGRCGKDSDDVPLGSLTQHLFLYFTERRILKQETLMLDGREALRTELSAKLDGVPRRFVVYVLKKDGCVYDFVLIAAPSVLPRPIQEFDQFVSGFSTRAPS